MRLGRKLEDIPEELRVGKIFCAPDGTYLRVTGCTDATWMCLRGVWMPTIYLRPSTGNLTWSAARYADAQEVLDISDEEVRKIFRISDTGEEFT